MTLRSRLTVPLLAAALLTSASAAPRPGPAGAGAEAALGRLAEHVADRPGPTRPRAVTLSPFGRYQYWSPANESERRQINRWIRSGRAFDGVIDFSAVLSDPQHPAWLSTRYDSGDHLHPNNAGHAAMARAVKLTLFTR